MYAFATDVADGGRHARVLLVQAMTGETIAAVLERIRRDHGGEEPVVVRLPIDLAVPPDAWSSGDATAKALIGDRDRLVGRTRTRSVHVLSSFEGNPYVTDALNAREVPDELVELDRGPLLEQLREAEFDHLVHRSKAMLTAPPGSQFRAPSGYLVDNFVRVGNIQADRDALDAVAFWMLEHLRDVDAIVTDTWSISSIALNAARVAATYYRRPILKVEMLPVYVDGTTASMGQARAVLQRVADDVGYPVEQDTKVLVLISATQSGGLVRHLEVVCQSAERAISPTFLAIFALRQGDVPRLSGMADDARFAFVKAQGDPQTVVDIDPQIYFPLSYVDVPYRLAKPDAERHRAFFDAYARTKVVRVHADDDRQDGAERHHAIRLDLSEIVGTERFLDALRGILSRLGPQKAILAPAHPAGQAFGKAVVREIEKRQGELPLLPIPGSPAIAQAGLRQVALDMIRNARSGDEFIILDDFSVDTSRLAQIDKQLRTAAFPGRINYVVGILAHEDPDEWNGFVRRLRPNGVDAVEQLPLPDLGRGGCPWCTELSLYDGWSMNGHALPPALEKRRATLAKSGTVGLLDDVLLVPEGMKPPELGPRSFYVRPGCSQAHVHAAASAALHALRTIGHPGKPKLGPRHYPIATVLDHEDYLAQKWTDTVLRASILRAGTVDELAWTRPASRRKRMEGFTKLLRRNAATEYDIVLEVLLAAASGKVELDLGDERLCRSIESRTQDGTAAYLLARLRNV